MKFFSRLFEILAGILMVVFVIFMPFTLLLQGVGGLLLSPGKMVELVEDNIIEVEVLATLAKNEINQREIDPQQDDTFVQFAVQGLKNFDDDQWEEMIRLVAPPELVKKSLEEVLIGYYRWVDGQQQVPDLTITMADWKTNLVKNFVPAMELVMFALPECTTAQLAQFFINASLDSGVPTCRPPEPVYGILVEQTAMIAPALIEVLPDEIDLGTDLETASVDWAGAKNSLQTLAFITQASWIAMLIIFVVAIPMGARSLSGVFQWAGWPIMLSGILTLILAVLLIAFSRGGLSSLNPLDEIARDASSVLAPQIERLFNEGVRFVARPLLFEAGAMILFGGVAVVIGIVITAKSSQKHEFVPPSSPSSSPQIPEQPDETIKFSEEQLDQPSEDEERPSGMFG